MKIIFISRAYPPVTGGIENQNYELSVWLPKNPDVAECRTIANRRGKNFLPLFLPWATIKAIFLMKKFDILLLGDGVLGITGYIVKLFCKKPVVCVVHGLDLTYENPMYQKLWVRRFIGSLDGLIAVSNETRNIAISRGIPEDLVFFIPNGVDSKKLLTITDRIRLGDLIGKDIADKSILLTYGRMVKRKGVAWFIEEVMPELPENILYVVAGNGPEKGKIAESISKNNLENRVFLLGYVSDKTKSLLLGSADIFIQPNIPVEGDVEGFGISVIEAGAAGLPVIASSLEGLKDAIEDGKNGILVETMNVKNFKENIQRLVSKPVLRKEFGEKTKKYVRENFEWNTIASIYVSRIKSVVDKK
jgi:glycosyltransferase involved in cell wall biosynthesis